MSDTEYVPFKPTAKSRRCYHRVISGIERGGTLRFLTLTSGPESPQTCQKSFRALYMRLKRRNLVQGYIKVPEASKNGKQHLHILFRGSYIESSLISAMWKQIHHAPVIDIRRVRQNGNKRRLASYMAKYLSKENIYRYSWNWGWVWRGFCRDWTELKRKARSLEEWGEPVPFKKILAFWTHCLHLGDPNPIHALGVPFPSYWRS